MFDSTAPNPCSDASVVSVEGYLKLKNLNTGAEHNAFSHFGVWSNIVSFCVHFVNGRTIDEKSVINFL